MLFLPSPLDARLIQAKLTRLIRGELDWIVMKALEKDRARRYESASALACDVLHYLSDEAVTACPPTMRYRLQKLVRRHRGMAITTSLIALSLILGLITTAWQAIRATHAERNLHELYGAEQQSRLEAVNARIEESRQKERAEQASRDAQRLAAESQQRLARQYIREGARAIEEGDASRALTWFAEAYRQEQPSASFASREIHQRRLTTIERQLPSLALGLFRNQTIGNAKLSPDGRRIVIHYGETLEIIDAHTGQVINKAHTLETHIWHAYFSADSQRVVAIAFPLQTEESEPSGVVTLFDAEFATPSCAPRRIHGLQASSLKMTHDGHRLFAIANNQIYTLDVSSGADVLPPVHVPDATALAVSPDGRRLAVWAHVPELKSEVRLYDTATMLQLGESQSNVQFDSEESTAAFSSDSQWLATFEYDMSGGRSSGPSVLKLCNAQTGDLFAELTTDDDVERTRFSTDNRRIFAHYRSGGLAIWNVIDRMVESSHPRLRHRIAQYALSPDGSSIASAEQGTNSFNVTVLDSSLATGMITYSMEFAGRIDQLNYLRDGRRLIVAAKPVRERRGIVHVIDCKTGSDAPIAIDRQYGSLDVHTNREGDKLLSLSDGGAVRLWDLRPLYPQFQRIRDFENRSVSCLRANRGRLLAIGQGPEDLAMERSGVESFGWLQVWDVRSWQPLGPKVTLASRVNEIGLSVDERRALVTLDEGIAALVDIVTGQVLQWYRADDGEHIRQASLASDGTVVATISQHIHENGYLNERAIRLAVWPAYPANDLPSSVPLARHERLVLSPQGNCFFSVSAGQHALIQPVSDASSGIALGPLRGEVQSAVFRPDGERIALVFVDGTVQQLSTKTGQVVAPILRGAYSEHVALGSDAAPLRFSEDGRFLLVRIDETHCQLFDSMTVEPMSIPMVTHSLLVTKRSDSLPVFDSSSNRLFSPSGNALAIWGLSANDITAYDWVERIQMLDGHRIDSVAGYVSCSPDSLIECSPDGR